MSGVKKYYFSLESESEDKLDMDLNYKSNKNLAILASILSIVTTALTVALILAFVSAKAIGDEEVCLTDECVLSAGYMSSSLDLSADPCDDFYKYTCGKWQEDHPFPAYVDGWSHFYKLSYTMRNDLRKLLENQTNFNEKPEAIQKMHHFYNGCLNQTNRNSIGYSPLLDEIENIGGWPTINSKWNESNYQWENALVKLVKIKLYPIIKVGVINDLKNTSRSIIKIGPYLSSEEELNGFYPKIKKLKKPSDDYYDSTDGKLIKSLIDELSNKEYDESQIDTDINSLHKFKLQLQKEISPINSAAYYQKHYDNHIFQIKDLANNFTDIDLNKILNGIFNGTISEYDVVFVPDINYLKKIGHIIKYTAQKERTIANLFATNFVLSFGQYTTTKMVELLVEKLAAPEVLPNICFSIVEKLMPNLLGRLYVDSFNKTLFGKKRDDLKNLIQLIHTSFYQLLDENDWMDNHTKQEAKNKLDAMSQNVAYPDWTMNDTLLNGYNEAFTNISAENFFSSVLLINEAKQTKNFMELTERLAPENTSIWPSHSAIDVNAFYFFTTNGIYVPAGIAQYPFYLFGRPMTMNLGSIGMIIGHEMTHSLDIHGSLYDSRGDLRNWWTNSTRMTFLNKSDCFVDQYNQMYFSEQNLTVNGSRTLAENIADNGGIREAYRAFELYKSGKPKKFLKLPGIMSQFSEDQLFFVSFANMWCSNMEPNALKTSLLTSVHSPESARVRGSLTNFDKFAKAFNCETGTKMNPKNKCIVW